MELQVYKDTLSAQALMCDFKHEYPIETEMLIPDYMPPIFKIVKTLVNTVALQKQVNGSRLQIEGYFKFTMFYQTEGDTQLCCFEHKLPFSKQTDLSAQNPQNCIIEADGELQYLNCRAINQRRVDVRGAVMLTIKGYCNENSELITAVSGGGARQNHEAVTGAKFVGCEEKMFTVEEELSFKYEPSAVLQTECVAVAEEIKLIQGKAVVKGAVSCVVIYKTGDNNALEKEKKSIPFSQIVDADGIGEQCECNVDVNVIGCSILAGDNGEERQGSISVNCIVSVKAYAAVEVYAVTDIFSITHETAVQQKNIAVDALLDTFANTIEIPLTLNMPDAGAQLLHTAIECTQPSLIMNGRETIVGGRATAHFICLNTLGEIDCYSKTVEYMLPKRYVTENKTVITGTAKMLRATATISGGDINAELTCYISGFAVEKTERKVVGEVQLGEEYARDEQEAALTIYFGEKGEKVFDIAKRFHAAPEDILRHNMLTDQQLAQNQRLLIPLAK